MPLPSSAQPRRPAGTPVGGQFAPTNRPEARDFHLVEEGPASGEHDIRGALLKIEQLGADSAERMVQVGKVAAALRSAARSVVGEALDGRRRSRRDDDAAVATLAELAIARAVHRSGAGHGRIEDLLSGLSAPDTKTSLERAARHYVRRALQADDEGDTSWVCPVNPSHATRDGVCTSCGAARSTNSDAVFGNPPVELMEPTGEDAEDDDPPDELVAAKPGSGTASAVPSKPERVLRELVSAFYRLQDEADEGNDDDMASAFERAAGMLDAAITSAFSGYDLAPNSKSATSRRHSAHIDLAEVNWIEGGDPEEPGGAKAQLYGTVQIDQAPFHVMALQVTQNDKEPQAALQRDDDLVSAMKALGDQGPYETVEIGGRPYVLLLSPHAR